VRERKVVEMDATIAELREKVVAAEKAYAAVKKRQGKTKPRVGKNRAPRFFLIGVSLSTRSMVAKVLGLKGCVTVPGERRTRPSPRLRGMVDFPLRLSPGSSQRPRRLPRASQSTASGCLDT
jgi:hypothetical protein